jgi:ATPase subunit of ABC transporter with duplicated ATPase domains
LANADFKLKTGVCYGLLGRNGTGKSTILRALSEKLIPGVSPSLRISILQQSAKDTPIVDNNNKTVFQHVIESNELRNDVLREIEVLSKDTDEGSDVWAQIRAYRQLKYQRLSRDLLTAERNARLRSRARGFQARRDLISFTKKVEDSKEAIDQTNEDLESAGIQEEIQAASDLLADLETQLESMRLSDIEAKAREVLQGLGFTESFLEKPQSTLGYQAVGECGACLAVF